MTEYCRNGHERTPENTHIDAAGTRRRCRVCSGNRPRIPGRCRSGAHEYTPENTYTYADGARVCRACRNASRLRWDKANVEHRRRLARERARSRHESRSAVGLCNDCEQPRMSEWYCWDCLNKMEERRASSF